MSAPTVFTAELEEVVRNVLLHVTPAAGTDELFVYRVGPSGVRGGVRGAYPLAVTGTAPLIIRDFEAPIGVPLTYYAYGDAEAEGVAEVEFEIIEEGCDDTWLTDLARPTNTQKILIESLPELAYEIPTGVHDVLGRRAPIVASDIASTPAFELSFITDDEDERERARAALGNGVPVLLRTPPENGIGSLYFSVLSFREQRIVNRAREDDRRFACTCVQVDRPDPRLYLPMPPATYDSIGATYATYALLDAAFMSYDAMLYEWEGVEAFDIVPWPPADV